MWRVFYADGSSFGSADGLPEASPAWGVVAIGQANGITGHSVLIGDFFLYFDRWYACDREGMIDQCVHRGHELRAFRLGRLLGPDEWAAVLSRAIHSDLPRRSAFLPGERVP